MDKKNIEALSPLFFPLVALLLGLYLLHKLTKGAEVITDIVTDKKSPEQIEASRKAIQGIVISPARSFTNAEFLQIANTLYLAFKGIGTDTEATRAVFDRLKTQNDWNMLINSFSIKEGMNLFEWIRNEIPQSSPVRLSINDLNEILTKKGIKQNLI